MSELFPYTFKAISKQLDERRAEGRRLWQQRLGTASEFCRAVVSNGYLTEEQMQRAARPNSMWRSCAPSKAAKIDLVDLLFPEL